MDFFLRTVKDSSNELHEGKPADFWGQGENDLVVDSTGDFALTEGVDNLRQSMAKILVTERGANSSFSIYGSLLQSFVGQHLDIDFLRAKIKTDIIDSLRIYQFINRGNQDLDEQIDRLSSLKMSLVGTGGIGVSFVVITKSNKNVGSIINIEG